MPHARDSTTAAPVRTIMRARGLTTILTLGVLSACATKITLRLENQGTSPLRASASCGDQVFKDTIKPARTIAWDSASNSCHVDLEGPGAGRIVEISGTCLDDQACALDISSAEVIDGTTRRQGLFGRTDNWASFRVRVTGDVAEILP